MRDDRRERGTSWRVPASCDGKKWPCGVSPHGETRVS
jgi:hypothetical protein